MTNMAEKPYPLGLHNDIDHKFYKGVPPFPSPLPPNDMDQHVQSNPANTETTYNRQQGVVPLKNWL